MKKLIFLNKKHFSFSIGLIGYPNVGKSTYFNTLIKRQEAEVKNLPFCTIKPNIASVGLIDDNLFNLANCLGSNNTLIRPYHLTVKDMAGMIKDSAKSEEESLSELRNVDALIQVIRCFEDSDIVYVDENVDPLNECKVIETELILSDIEFIEKRMKKAKKSEILDFYNFLLKNLNEGKMLKDAIKTENSKLIANNKEFLQNLLTFKEIFYILNISHKNKSNLSENFIKTTNLDPNKFIETSIQLENEAIELTSDLLPDKDYQKILQIKQEYFNCFDGFQSKTDILLEKIKNHLKLNTFYTIYGGNIASSYLLREGSSIIEAAAKVHSDFAKKFISADVSKPEHWLKEKTKEELKRKKLIKTVKNDYKIENFDIIEIYHSA